MIEEYCCPNGLATGILLESVVNRLCKLARASLDEVCTLGKKGLCSLVDEPLGLNVPSASGDRRLGNRSSSIRPLSVFEKAMTGDLHHIHLVSLRSFGVI